MLIKKDYKLIAETIKNIRIRYAKGRQQNLILDLVISELAYAFEINDPKFSMDIWWSYLSKIGLRYK